MTTSLVTSLWIAQILGPVLLIATFGMIVNRETYVTMAREFVASPALIYLAGVLTLVAGLAITLSHNVWVMDWPVMVTIFGWLAIAGGIFRMSFPNMVSKMSTSMIEKYIGMMPVTISIVGLLGALLTWYGYMT